MPTIAVLGAAGVAGVIAATSRYGPGLASDSANYFSAAASLRAGDGLLGVTGAPLVAFPPLYPAALAILETGGLSAAAAARALSACGLVAVLAVTVVVTARLTRSQTAAAVAALLVLLCAPHLDAFTWALSETLFIGLLACFVTVFARLGHEGNLAGTAALGLLGATLPLTRYVGVVLLPAAALTMVVVSRDAVRRRLLRAGLFVAVAASPLALYLMRNAAVSGDLAGARGASTASAVSVARGLVAAAVDWLLPGNWLLRLQGYSDAPWALALFFVAAALAAGAGTWLLWRWWSESTDRPQARGIVLLLSLWVAGYAAFLCLSALTIAFNPIGPRFLVPLVFPVAILAATALTDPVRRPAHRAWQQHRTAALVAVLVGLGLLQAGRVTLLIADKRAAGAGGFATQQWQESPFLAYLAADPPPDGTMTNAPDALYLATGRRYPMVPRADSSAQRAAVRAAVARGEDVRVAWFDAVDWRPYLGTRRTVAAWPLVIRHVEADGALYGVESLPR